MPLLQVNEITKETGAMYINNGPALYITADKKTVVEEGDPRAAFLLVGNGGQLPDDEAAQYGLTGSTTEEKAVSGGSENKLLTPATEDKGTIPTKGPVMTKGEPTPEQITDDDLDLDMVVFEPDPALRKAVEEGSESPGKALNEPPLVDLNEPQLSSSRKRKSE